MILVLVASTAYSQSAGLGSADWAGFWGYLSQEQKRLYSAGIGQGINAFLSEIEYLRQTIAESGNLQIYDPMTVEGFVAVLKAFAYGQGYGPSTPAIGTYEIIWRLDAFYTDPGNKSIEPGTGIFLILMRRNLHFKE